MTIEQLENLFGSCNKDWFADWFWSNYSQEKIN